MKKQIGKLILKRTDESQRKKRGFTLHNAQDVAVLSIIEKESDYTNLTQRIFDLRSDHGVKKVTAFAFVNFHEKKKPTYIEANRDLVVFYRSDLSWKSLPTAEVRKVSGQNFDLLLDLFGKECTPLEYLWRTIPASLKVSHEAFPTAEYSDLLASCASKDPSEVYLAYEELLTKYDLK